jgi:hypothetical protein
VSREVLARLRALLREQGGLIATLIDDRPAPTEDTLAQQPPASPAAVLAEGPRTSARAEEYQLLVEAIYEGYLLHYGCPRVVRAEEADLALLAGDSLYAIGLARLVALGDTLGVAELADTITLCALAHSGDDPELAHAVWAAGTRAVGWGTSEQHRHAKELALVGAAQALDAMRTFAGLDADSRPGGHRYC